MENAPCENIGLDLVEEGSEEQVSFSSIMSHVYLYLAPGGIKD